MLCKVEDLETNCFVGLLLKEVHAKHAMELGFLRWFEAANSSIKLIEERVPLDASSANLSALIPLARFVIEFNVDKLVRDFCLFQL